MTLRQQIIQDRVEQIQTSLGIDEDQAFLRFAHQIVTGISVLAFDESDSTGGGQDKQIDIITIEEEPSQATVYIIQAKNSESFSSNALIQMKNGLHWLFNKPISEIRTLSNISFRDKIIANDRFESIIRDDEHNVRDIDKALKSYTIDEQIDRNLYR